MQTMMRVLKATLVELTDRYNVNPTTCNYMRIVACREEIKDLAERMGA